MRGWAAWLLLVVAACGTAKADTTYPGSGSVDGFSGSGTLYATSNGSSYTITGIDGPGVTGLIAAGGFNGNDNLLFPDATPTLDGHGFAFNATMDDTDFQVNLFSAANGTFRAHIVDSDDVVIDDPATFTLGSAMSSSGTARLALLRENSLTSGTAQAFSFSFAAAPAVSETPEPGSFALFGTGLLGAAALVRRRARK